MNKNYINYFSFAISFEERLAAQRAEKERMEAEAKKMGFKKQLSKEEKAEKKKLRLAAIGKLKCLYTGQFDQQFVWYLSFRASGELFLLTFWEIFIRLHLSVP